MENLDVGSTIINGFRSWVEQQPENKKYNYFAPGNCAFAQYLKALGYKRPDVDPYVFRLDRRDEISYDLPEDLDDALYLEPSTFGNLAKRLEVME
jgi:hypothetical protein